MAERSLTRVKVEFFESLIESVNGLPRLEAEQRLSSIFCDLWNEAEQEVKKLPVKVRVEKRL
jgi:hypothetical protein